MSNAWYRRKEHGPLGYTYPTSWKGWVHLLAAPAIFIGPVLLAMEAEVFDRHPWIAWVGAFLLFMAWLAIGWAKTEYSEV